MLNKLRLLLFICFVLELALMPDNDAHVRELLWPLFLLFNQLKRLVTLKGL